MRRWPFGLLRGVRGLRDQVAREYLDYLPEAVQRVLQQVHTDRRLAESEARLALVIASAKDAILIAGADHQITLFNQAAEEMFRVPPTWPWDCPSNSFSWRNPVAPRPHPFWSWSPTVTRAWRARCTARFLWRPRCLRPRSTANIIYRYHT